MRDIFRWDRTTVNFFRYVSVHKVPDKSAVFAGRHVVVYIPRDGRADPPSNEKEFIVSHMLPSELDLKPYGEPETERPIYGRSFTMVTADDPIVARIERKLSAKVDTHFFTARQDEIFQRIRDLEFGQSVLFKAVYWILRRLRVVK